MLDLLALWGKVLLYGGTLCIFAFLLNIVAGLVMSGVILLIGCAGTFFRCMAYSSDISQTDVQNDIYIPRPGQPPPHTASTP
jgi:hypothetical protein